MADLVTISAKVPATLADRAETLAASKLLTVSRLIRRALERELAADEAGADAGPVEVAARMEIVSWGAAASETRAQAALNLARRVDSDPASAAQNVRELRLLLDDLSGSIRRDFGVVDELQARRVLRLAGWRLISPSGVEVGS